MFDDILNLVKEHLGNNPEISSAIPADQTDAVHNEIAKHINNNLSNQPAGQNDGVGGMFSNLENNMASGGMATNAIEGGLVSSLASKFGLSPLITGAIAGALPGLLQKYMAKKAQGNISS